ncbi:MAG: MarR family transcriptional regulator [Alphaproteobacteria bacterium]|nr:MarR family transcriptional regulator [Alphaproteobacteria bacterium]
MEHERPSARTLQVEPRPEPDAAPLALEEFLPYRLSVLANRVSAALARLYQDRFGLSIPEWRVMAVLGRFAPLSSNEVCERTSMDKAKVSRAIARMVAAGLVSRAPHARDQRLVSLALAAEGRRVYEQIVPLARDWERALVAGIAPADRAALLRLLALLEQRVGALPGAGID